MSDNVTNDDNVSQRPKRRATQRTHVIYENTTEDKDLKRALLASLQDIKKSVQTNKSSAVCPQNGKSESTLEKKTNKSQVLSKLKDSSSQSSQMSDPNCSLLSLAAQRRSRVSAQRKFAQSSGFATNSPVSTPIKSGFVGSHNVVDLFPNQKPITEDFLTFLCFRRSPILPPNLDFYRIENDKKGNEEKTSEDNCENLSADDLEANDKYTTCRLRASADRRGSASSTVSKAASMSSRTSLQSSNRKKSEIQRKDIKQNGNTKSKNQSILNENGLKNTDSVQKSVAKTSKADDIKVKTFDSLKQKYKQQRIEKNIIPSKGLNTSKKTESKDNSRPQKSDSVGIQTRQKIRTMSLNTSKDVKPEADDKRILRSHQSVATHVSEPLRKASHPKTSTNAKTNKSLNSSQIGIRPKTRKAKPVVPLIDYYFDSEFESESEKRVIRKNGIDSKIDNKSKESKEVKNNDQKKKISKPMSTQTRDESQTRLQVSDKSKTQTTSTANRRLTRSCRPLTTSSKPVMVVDSELERQIKEKIIAIERKHKRLRRCPSNLSLHSSDSSSSSSSSESLPNSLSSSSSSIDNTRLTRSLGHLKKIRDYQAKLKKEQNNKSSSINTAKDNSKNKPKTKSKQENVTKRQSVSSNSGRTDDKKTDTSAKKSKTSNRLNSKAIVEKKSSERVVTRRMRESIISAMSDTDCDTEGEDWERMLSATEDSMASILNEDMERASIVLQDMAEDMSNSLLVNRSSETDPLHYESAEHMIEGLMTSQFSGAFSDETVTTASAILLPSNGQSLDYSPIDPNLRSTVDASTNTTEDDILSSSLSSSDETRPDSPDYESYECSKTVGTQTTANSAVQTDPSLEC